MEIVLDTSTHVIEDGSPHYGIPRTDEPFLASSRETKNIRALTIKPGCGKPT
jgi:hypothetical protein